MGSKGHLRIGTACDDSHVWVSIGDTGGGIDPARVGTIFQPYYTTKENGSGLGLHIVQRIVRAHGGEIMIQSAMGQGMLFTIRLPRDDRRVRFLPPITEEKDSQG
jgi:two-component system sensor histidine kinase HydH